MRLALFALTGFGNIVLKSFLNQGVKPLVLVTRKEKNKFPYYKLENISSPNNLFILYHSPLRRLNSEIP